MALTLGLVPAGLCASSEQEPITLRFIYGKNNLTDDLATNPMFLQIQEKPT